VRFDHVTRGVKNVGHGIMRAALKLSVADCMASFKISQPSEWQRIENKIEAAMILVGTDFVRSHSGARQEKNVALPVVTLGIFRSKARSLTDCHFSASISDLERSRREWSRWESSDTEHRVILPMSQNALPITVMIGP
jgi:hypothetical protein